MPDALGMLEGVDKAYCVVGFSFVITRPALLFSCQTPSPPEKRQRKKEAWRGFPLLVFIFAYFFIANRPASISSSSLFAKPAAASPSINRQLFSSIVRALMSMPKPINLNTFAATYAIYSYRLIADQMIRPDAEVHALLFPDADPNRPEAVFIIGPDLIDRWLFSVSSRFCHHPATCSFSAAVP